MPDHRHPTPPPAATANDIAVVTTAPGPPTCPDGRNVHEETRGRSAPRYPVAPLLALTGLTISQLTRRHGISGTTATLGLTETVADRVACHHGLHPYVVWPDMADHHLAAQTRTCADDRCGGPFVADRPNQRYCTTRCSRRAYMREWKRRRYQTDPEYRARCVEESRAYRAEIGADAVRAAERRRYHADADTRRARRRERYHREKETTA